MKVQLTILAAHLYSAIGIFAQYSPNFVKANLGLGPIDYYRSNNFPSIHYYNYKRSVNKGIKNQFEVTPYYIFNNYGEFSYVLGGRPSIDHIKIKGSGFGINIAYKIPLSNNYFLKPAIGFYKYTFNNIERSNTNFGSSNSRHINFPSPLLIQFFTDTYWYNCFTVYLGIEKSLLFNNDFQAAVGINFSNHFTFSQYYHLTNNASGSSDFKKSEKYYFGPSLSLNGGLLKSFKEFSIGPTLIIPIYDSWKTDNTFPEESKSGSRNKWLNGIGIGFTINYSVSKS